jgi:hypothetical protein
MPADSTAVAQIVRELQAINEVASSQSSLTIAILIVAVIACFVFGILGWMFYVQQKSYNETSGNLLARIEREPKLVSEIEKVMEGFKQNYVKFESEIRKSEKIFDARIIAFIELKRIQRDTFPKYDIPMKNMEDAIVDFNGKIGTFSRLLSDFIVNHGCYIPYEMLIEIENIRGSAEQANIEDNCENDFPITERVFKQFAQLTIEFHKLIQVNHPQ